MPVVRRRRPRPGDDGFTLIELMVVVLIIAVLIAIAIPTFLGARSRAQDRTAQSNLRNALSAEKTWYTDKEAYTADGSDATGLGSVEPAITFVSSSLAAPPAGQVALAVGDVTTGDSNIVCMTAHSASGSDWVLADIASGANAGTYYGNGTITACTETVVAALPQEW